MNQQNRKREGVEIDPKRDREREHLISREMLVSVGVEVAGAKDIARLSKASPRMEVMSTI